MAIFGACKRGDITQHRRWGRQGVRVKSADVLIGCIFKEINFDNLRCLVKELGSDVNGVRLRDGGTPLYAATQIGSLSCVQLLVKELGADVNQAGCDGATPVYVAAQIGNLAVVRLLAQERGADIRKARHDGGTPLHVAAQKGSLDVVRFMVKELRADVNQLTRDGLTPLMLAARNEHEGVVTFLIKYGAHVKDSTDAYGTAADISRRAGASAEQTQYLEARTHCAKPECDGAGAKKCAGCLKVYYCTRECQLAHWPAHKTECRQSANKAASKKT
jgi:hypothetical protein